MTTEEATGTLGEYYAMVTGKCYGPALRLNKRIQTELRREYDATTAPSQKSFELAKQISSLAIDELVLAEHIASLIEQEGRQRE